MIRMDKVNRRNLTIIWLLCCWNFLGIESAIVEPPNSIYNACPGDTIVILCNITRQILIWTWQNETSEEQFQFHGVEDSAQMLNVNYNFTNVPGVTVTLLKLKGTSSSLQFVISETFKSARISCNGDHREIMVQTNLSSTPITFNLSHTNHNRSVTSISLTWNATMESMFLFHVNVSSNSTNSTIISQDTNKPSIYLSLKNGEDYLITIEKACCEVTCAPVGNLIINLSKCYNSCTTIYGRVLFPTTKTIVSYASSSTTGETTNTSIGLVTSSTVMKKHSTQVSESATSGYINTESDVLSYIKPIGGLFGGIAVLIIIVIILLIFGIIIFNKNKRRKDKGTIEVSNTQDEVEYHHIQFSNKLQTNYVEQDEYGTLNTEFMHTPVLNDEEYSTLNQPHVLKSAYVKDDYEYTSINCQNIPNEKKVQYAILEDSSIQNKVHSNSTHMGVKDVKYSILQPDIDHADALLSLDSLLIELRDIAPKWKELGRHLNFTTMDMQAFKQLTNGTDFECLVELCDNWLRKTEKPTWKFIAQIMAEMGEQELSEEILEIYNTGQLPARYDGNDDEYEGSPPPIPVQNF